MQNHHRLLRRSALCVALGLSFAGGVHAQTNTAGAVAGRANAGDTITIDNPATGFSRTITVGADGQYRLSQVPIGRYTVTRKGTDGSSTSRTASVNVGTAANVSFDAQTLETVTVVGASQINPIDVTSVESTTILTSEQLAKIPVSRDITSVALLAPGTVKGDAAFGNLASFGGSSVAENQYYVNGFNVTNTFRNLNFADIPFEAIAEQQIKTGGYGAEFGRSTGGVINLITKRGTNEFHAGGNLFYSPEFLTGDTPDRFNNTGPFPRANPAVPSPNDAFSGMRIEDNSKDKGWQATASLWASGALIKDKLFAYGLVQYGRDESDTYPFSTTGIGAGTSNRFDKLETPKWLVKLDWMINDSNNLELTAFSDKTKRERSFFRTSFGANAASRTATPTRGAFQGTEFIENGGDNYVLKYTGYLTDSLTLSALAGRSEFSRSDFAVSANGIRSAYAGNLFGPVAGCPRVIDSRDPANQAATGVFVGCNFMAGIFGGPDNKDTRDQYRVDVEWQLGDHLLRGGVDIDNFTTTDANAEEGGVRYQYFTDGAGNDFVERTFFRNAATVDVDQRAFYLEDSWNVTANFIAYLGVRWDTFDNKNGLGESFVKIDDQFAPRLGFSWDVYGDSSFKVFGNAGRYALPLTSNVAIRGASASRFEVQDFVFTGVDPVTKEPLGLAPCPADVACDFPNIQFQNNEFGVPKNAEAIASANLQPMYQDEYILGFQKQLNDHFSLGIRGIYRDLKRAIDDQCDFRAIVDWAQDNGFHLGEGPEDASLHELAFVAPNPNDPNQIALLNPGFPGCRLYNPGSDGAFTADINGDGTFERFTISADKLGPAAKRKYTAVEFFWQGNWDRFFLQGSYTFARSVGNTEGGVKSDNGQQDTGTTTDFDYPELMLGAYGYLPNDRRHTLKLFGNYELTDEWSVGANLLVQSGRPRNCIGIFGDDPAGYGASYFSCDPGVPQPGTINNGSTIVPRGTAGRLPWSSTIDLNIAYRPAFAEGLQFKVDIFNVLNTRKPTSVNDAGENNSGNPFGNPQLLYGVPLSRNGIGTFQQPRSVRFMVQYDF